MTKPSVLLAFALALAACGGESGDGDTTAPASAHPGDVAFAWMETVYSTIKAEKTGPPPASRIYAYTGLALFEAVVPGIEGRASLGGVLKGLDEMPQPDGAVDWPSAANAAVAAVVGGLMPSASAESKAALGDLRDRIHNERAEAIGDAGRVADSEAFGVAVAEVILKRASEDGFAENVNKGWTPPAGPDKWVPTPPSYSAYPALPHWGGLTPFALSSASACEPAPPVEYSEEPGSAMYAEALAVYNAVNANNPEWQAIAWYWADGPGDTGTPPGHWIALAAQLGREEGMDLAQASEAFALTGIATADAFIACWHSKFKFNLLRPVTYIQRVIDPDWQSYITTPVFPEYTSGHSTSSGAATTVLTHLWGTRRFTDRIHEEIGMPPRTYESFGEAGFEAAQSRLYGGIHFPMGNINGLIQGQCVGQFVMERAGR